MNFEDEKDYIMRIIKETVRLLFSLMLGKNYVSVEQELKNKYEVSGRTLDNLLSMADDGKINEAENIILDGIDYSSKNEVAAAALFYHHLSEMEENFLDHNNYSQEDILDGLKQVVEEAGYGNLAGIVE